VRHPPGEARALSFLDVPPGHPDAGHVADTALRGMFTGFPDGTFRGDRPVTWPEVAVVLQRVTTELRRLLNGRCHVRKNAAAAPPDPMNRRQQHGHAGSGHPQRHQLAVRWPFRDEAP
jgi:hypothetical protein